MDESSGESDASPNRSCKTGKFVFFSGGFPWKKLALVSACSIMEFVSVYIRPRLIHFVFTARVALWFQLFPSNAAIEPRARAELCCRRLNRSAATCGVVLPVICKNSVIPEISPCATCSPASTATSSTTSSWWTAATSTSTPVRFVVVDCRYLWWKYDKSWKRCGF